MTKYIPLTLAASSLLALSTACDPTSASGTKDYGSGSGEELVEEQEYCFTTWVDGSVVDEVGVMFGDFGAVDTTETSQFYTLGDTLCLSGEAILNNSGVEMYLYAEWDSFFAYSVGCVSEDEVSSFFMEEPMVEVDPNTGLSQFNCDDSTAGYPWDNEFTP